jgi:hypothetical protein
MERFVEVQGVRVPRFIYGTAWKEHRTEGLTRLALEVGFRGIDTANQRKHYFEAGVGAAIAAAGIARDELFLQAASTMAASEGVTPASRFARTPREPNFREPAPERSRVQPSRACEWRCLTRCAGARSRPGDKSDRLRGVGQTLISLARTRA